MDQARQSHRLSTSKDSKDRLGLSVVILKPQIENKFVVVSREVGTAGLGILIPSQFSVAQCGSV